MVLVMAILFRQKIVKGLYDYELFGHLREL